jgi:methylated-DNA-[protein]-cysteine S-methyltransferase
MKKNNPDLQLHYQCFTSALGWILLAASSKGISLLHFCGLSPPSRNDCEAFLKQTFGEATVVSFRASPLLQEAKGAVLMYLHGRRPLASLPLDVQTGTPFQHRVWNALCQIPFGQTMSYFEVAQAIGKPRAARAVGQACGSNSVSLLIPCHRVIAADGKLGGFSGGTHIKESLLEIERNSGLA